MSATTFYRFTELPLELRNQIWEFAIASHVEDTGNRLPRWFVSPWAERRRQAIVGGFPGKERPPLCVSILDPYDGLKIRLDEDDFESFVDCFPISAVCRETRVNVAEFCRSLVPHVQLDYSTFPIWSLKPPEKGAEPVLLRNLHCLPGAETLEHVFSQPETLTLNVKWFKSAKHLVGMLFRFFGYKIQRLIITTCVHDGDPVERAYWSGSGAVPTSIESTPDHDPTRDSISIYVTKDRKLLVSESLWQVETLRSTDMTMHLLKMYEVFDASLEKLPGLEQIDVNLKATGMDGTQFTDFSTTWKRDFVAGKSK